MLSDRIQTTIAENVKAQKEKLISDHLAAVSAYQDGNGIIYYEGNGYVREGIYGGYDESGFFYLKGGTVYQDSIRRRTEFFGNGGGHQEEEIHYYGMEEEEDKFISDEEITRERYEAIREEYVRNAPFFERVKNAFCRMCVMICPIISIGRRPDMNGMAEL